MPIQLPESLETLLLPLLIAVPLAIVVWLISTRRGDALNEDAAPQPVPPPPPPAPRLPVLVVDDSAVVRAKLIRLLQAEGHEVEAAGDGLQAMDALARRRFGVLITDLEMPNMDGFELIATVQGSRETEDLPILAITGHDELHARVHQVQGVYGLFKKPWNDRELLKRVETLLQLGRRPVEAP